MVLPIVTQLVWPPIRSSLYSKSLQSLVFVGYRVGSTVGLLVGTVGKAVGFNVTTSVGVSVGSYVGSTVGLLGCAVGLTDGLDGLTVDITVGTRHSSFFRLFKYMRPSYFEENVASSQPFAKHN